MFDFLLYRISMLWMFIFIIYFLPRAGRLWKTVFLFAICFVVCTICDYITILHPEWGIKRLTNSFIQALLVQRSVFHVCRYHDGRAIFVGFTGAVYVLLGNVFATEFYVWGGHFVVGLLIAAVTHFLLFLFLYIKLREAFLRQLEKQTDIWLRLCSIPLLFYLSVYSIMVWPADIDKNPQNFLGVLFILLLMIVSYVVIFSAMDSYEKLERQRSDMALLEKYADGMQQQLELMRINEEKNAILRHDMKHYSVVLSSYLRNGEYDKVKEVMEGTVSRLKELECEVFCENVAVNSIVSHYAAEARREGIKFDCRMDIPRKLSVDEFEFVVVLSNLLSNAVREAGANEGQPGEIRIYAQRIRTQLVMEITNTFVHEVVFGEDGLPVSKRGDGHGYGSRSIQVFVRKYKAVYDCQVKGNLFSVRLLLNI